MPQVTSSLPVRRRLAMIKANDRTAVEAIIAQDPFNINGIADYQIVEFTPSVVISEDLKQYLL